MGDLAALATQISAWIQDDSAGRAIVAFDSGVDAFYLRDATYSKLVNEVDLPVRHHPTDILDILVDANDADWPVASIFGLETAFANEVKGIRYLRDAVNGLGLPPRQIWWVSAPFYRRFMETNPPDIAFSHHFVLSGATTLPPATPAQLELRSRHMPISAKTTPTKRMNGSRASMGEHR